MANVIRLVVARNTKITNLYNDDISIVQKITTLSFSIPFPFPVKPNCIPGRFRKPYVVHFILKVLDNTNWHLLFFVFSSPYIFLFYQILPANLRRQHLNRN